MSMAVQPFRHFTFVDRSVSQSITKEFRILYDQAAMTCGMFISSAVPFGEAKSSDPTSDPGQERCRITETRNGRREEKKGESKEKEDEDGEEQEDKDEEEEEDKDKTRTKEPKKKKTRAKNNKTWMVPCSPNPETRKTCFTGPL